MNISMGSPKGVVLGAEPRANLLPPEVRQADQARLVRRVLAFLVVITIVIVGGGYLASTFRANQAQGGLDAANARTVQLQKERLGFAEVTSLSNLVNTVTAARTVAVSKEVMWKTYYDAIINLLPAGVTLTSGTMISQLPWQPEMAMTGPLRVQGVATITFVLSSDTVINETAVVRRLAEFGGFGDASTESLTAAVGKGYLMNVTLNLTNAAVSGRFAPVAEEASK